MARELDLDEKPMEPEQRRKWQARQQDYVAWGARCRADDHAVSAALPTPPAAATEGETADGGQSRQSCRRKLEPANSPRFRPLYVIQHSSLQDHPNPLGVVEHLVDCISDPRWRRDPLCHGCESWTAARGLADYPHRPGAWDTAHESCSGCWYTYLIDVRRLERIAKRRAGAARPVRRRRKPRVAVQ